MAHLFNRNVLLGVSGGIAAYKSAELVRALQDRGAQVRVIMTHGAQEFITPLTLQALSGNPVHTELLDERAELGMGHIELARWADLLLVAPATADLISRLSAGRADDLLSTVALATAAPLMLAPAMNQQMWRDQATVDNVKTLADRGVHLVGPAAGQQACGDVGPGRMEAPAAIADAAAALFALIATGLVVAVSYYGLPDWVPVSRSLFGPDQPDLVLDFPPDKQDRRALPNGTEFFAANGTITNVGRETHKVPSILIVMRDQRNKLVYSWEVVPPEDTLAPGESVTVNEVKRDVPKSAKYAEIGWKAAR